MSDLESLHLFKKVKEGDLKAFEKLFKSYYPQLLRYALSMVRNESVAEEITQEIFIYIWEKRKEIELKSDLKAYLFTSVRYKALNYIKLELPRQQATTDLEGIHSLAQPEMTINESHRIKQKIQYAIDQLPEQCKKVFVLSRYGEMTYKEISSELGLSVKTVENQMSIALKKLREMLKNELKEFNIK